jgi:hypothetical protein
VLPRNLFEQLQGEGDAVRVFLDVIRPDRVATLRQTRCPCARLAASAQPRSLARSQGRWCAAASVSGREAQGEMV